LSDDLDTLSWPMRAPIRETWIAYYPAI
jgi:hypothetical protein